MIEEGVPKNMGAISGGLEIIWDKKQFVTLFGKTDTNAFPLNGQEKRF